MAQALFRAALTYAYNMITARLTQGEIVPELRAQLYAKLQRLSFSFFDVHGSNSIFNRVTGDVQNTRLFVDGVLLQGVNMLLTLAAYAFFMWRIHPALTLACLSVSLPLWWLAHFYSARLRPGYLRNRELTDNMVLLFSESVRGMQTVKGFAAEPAPGPPFRSRERPGFLAAAENFLGLVRLHARHANAVAIEPGDSVRLWRLAVCAGENSAGQRAGGVRGIAPAIHRTSGQYLDHRKFRAAKPRGGAAGV